MECAQRIARVSFWTLLATACSAPPPRVQVEPDAVACYLPRDYEAEFFVDYDQLRDLDLLEWIDEMPFAPGFFTALARGYGCELDDLHLVRTGVRFVEQGTGSRFALVSVAVREPRDSPSLPDSWKASRIAAHDGFEQDIGSGRSVLVFPHAGRTVAGDAELVEASLADAGGRPHPDLAPLLVGDRIVGQIAIGRFGRPMHEVTGSIGWYWHDADDPADFLRLRLARGDEDHLVVEVLVRFAEGTTGIAEIERDVRGALDAALARQELRAVHALARAVELRREGRDFCARVDLGTPRQAFAAVERLVLALAANHGRERRRRRGLPVHSTCRYPRVSVVRRRLARVGRRSR